MMGNQYGLLKQVSPGFKVRSFQMGLSLNPKGTSFIPLMTSRNRFGLLPLFD